jgi:hypothetical protein
MGDFPYKMRNEKEENQTVGGGPLATRYCRPHAAGRCWKVDFASRTRRMHAVHVLGPRRRRSVRACMHASTMPCRGYG